MKKFVAYLHQEGGCDYTIGCGNTMINLEAEDMNSAELELESIIKSDYNSRESTLSSATIYEVTDERPVKVRLVYDRIREEENSEKRKKLEDSERQEYERLVKKFGDFKDKK